MRLDEIQQLAREVALAITAENVAIGRRHRRLGQEEFTVLTELEAERLIFDVLDRKLWTP